MEEIIYWAPSPPPVPVSVSFMSYNGFLRVGIESDRASFVSADKIIEVFENGEKM